MMHQNIINHNASVHYVQCVFSDNRGMHEQTRENIKQLMARNEVPSERQLALDCGMSQSTLHRFMKGDTDSLDFVHLQSIAHNFGITVSQLIGETPLDEDRKVRSVLLAMQQMPEYKKDMLVAASVALTEQPPQAANGH